MRVDFSGAILEMNDSATAMLGFADGAPIGSMMADVLVPERFRAQAVAGLARLRAGERPPILGQTVRVQVIRAPAEEVAFLVTVIDQGATLVVFLTDTEPPATPCAHDVTELTGARQALAAHAAVDAALGEWESTSGGIVGLLRRLTLAMDWTSGTLWVPEARSDALVCRARWARPDSRALSDALQQRLHEGLAATVWATRKTRAAPGAIAFGVQSDADFLGVLEFQAPGEDEFSASLLETLGLIGRTYLGEFLLRHRGTLGSSPLTLREREVLQLATDGGSSAAIARKLVISTSTVKTHFEHIYQKLGAADRAEAVAEGFRQGLVQ